MCKLIENLVNSALRYSIYTKIFILSNNAENYFFDKRFNSVQKDTNGKIGSQEEYKTVGIGFTKEEAEKQEKFGLRNDDGSIRVTGKYNNSGDITENMLRLELELPLRLNYYRRIYIEQKSNIKK